MDEATCTGVAVAFEGPDMLGKGLLFGRLAPWIPASANAGFTLFPCPCVGVSKPANDPSAPPIVPTPIELRELHNVPIESIPG
mgnify:CR=1 FL=1